MRIQAANKIVATLATLVAGVANSAPVSVLGQQWFFDHFSYLQTSTGSSSFGEATCLSGCNAGWTYEQQLSNEFGSAYSRAHGFIDSYSSASGESATWGAIGRLETIASVDLGLTDGRAVSEAQMFGFLVAFAVTEAVLFTGTHGLEGFASGSILQPGTYFSRQEFLPALSVEALAGETISRTVTRGIEFNFTAIPAPPAVALFFCGLLAMGVTRAVRRRATSASS